MNKYTGDPATEAEHIQNNLLRSKLNQARQKVSVLSGAADSGIQSMTKTAAPKTVGKYWSSGANMSTPDLSALPSILDRHLNMLNQQRGTSVEEQHQQIFNSGEFAVARKRQSIWGISGMSSTSAPVVVAMSNTNANDQEAAMLSGRNISNQSQPTTIPPSLKSGGIPSNVGSMPQGQAMTPEQLRKKNFDLDAIERKMGIGVKPKNETEDQMLRRLGLK